jgi:hypothetical protein
MHRFFPVVTIMLGLSGCSGAPKVYGEYVQSTYSTTEFGYGAGHRDLWTQFRGDPFGLGDDAFADSMTDVLRRHPPRPQPANYTTDPGESARQNYRVVFYFDPPTSYLTTRLCRLPQPMSSGEGGKKPLRVAAAFCRGQGVLTAVRGHLDDVDGIDDPAFDRLIGQLVYALFPTHDSDRDGRGGGFIILLNS